jgi:hypothetical protein
MMRIFWEESHIDECAAKSSVEEILSLALKSLSRRDFHADIGDSTTFLREVSMVVV